MENLFEIEMDRRSINAISNVGLAHIGDAVYSLLCRTYLCARGEQTIRRLHDHSVALVNAAAQARFADRIEPLLTDEERAYYRRGKNAHTHAAPRAATPQQYSKATGLETLFGALYLAGKRERLNELFAKMMEETDGL